MQNDGGDGLIELLLYGTARPSFPIWSGFTHPKAATGFGEVP